MNKNDFKSDKPKRYRRTKAELEAAGYYKDKSGQNDGKKAKNDRQNDDKSIVRKKFTVADFEVKKKELENKENEFTTKVEEVKETLSKMKTIDEVCEEQIQRAKDNNLPKPNFDYRQIYSKGQEIYYIEVNELCGTKKMLELTVSSVYPRAVIAYEDRGMAHTIGVEDEEMIYLDRHECESVYNNIIVENKLEEYFQRQKQLANKRRREENGNA